MMDGGLGLNHCPFVPADLRTAAEAAGVPWWHTHEYATNRLRDRLAGRRVLIVGGSDSASDVAVDLVHRRTTDDHARGEVYVSIQRGQWFQDRMGGGRRRRRTCSTAGRWTSC